MSALPDEPALFRARPELRGRVPWTALGSCPTPIERFDVLSGASGGSLSEFDGPGSVELWAKRDDAASEIYGGNKVRKLEFVLADAEAQGARRLFTIGRHGSHQALAVALFGAAYGFEVEAVLLPQESTPAVRENLERLRAAGAILHMEASYPRALPKIWRLARRPGTYFVPAGSSSPTGNLGWVSGICEIVEQIEASQCPPFDRIYAPLGTTGTVAGLWLGARLAGLKTEIVGVEVARRPLVSSFTVAERLAHAVDRRFDLGVDLSAPKRDLIVDQRFFGDGYGTPSAAADEATTVAARGGVELDLTYSARGFAAVLEDARSGRLDGKRVLWIHTLSSASL